MSLSKHYQPDEMEPKLQSAWESAEVYHYFSGDQVSIYSIDTPPPTVSGSLHLGHTYSYTHTDVFARFHRMRGENVFYPMGFDDNGLPTERLVERKLGATAEEIGRQTFIEKCLQISQEIESEYQNLWQRLGLSIDWRYTYRTFDECSRRTSQRSFIDLY
ncbi:MAG: class I tRNA ligase family protein, partial [Chloroflexota bacterium]